jgi:hypothetical protein
MANLVCKIRAQDLLNTKKSANHYNTVTVKSQLKQVICTHIHMYMQAHIIHFQTQQHYLIPDCGFYGGFCHAVLILVAEICQLICGNKLFRKNCSGCLESLAPTYIWCILVESDGKWSRYKPIRVSLRQWTFPPPGIYIYMCMCGTTNDSAHSHW